MLMTRGVLYTAITRARELLIVVGDEERGGPDGRPTTARPAGTPACGPVWRERSRAKTGAAQMRGIYFLFKAGTVPSRTPSCLGLFPFGDCASKSERPRIRAAAFADWMYRFCD